MSYKKHPSAPARPTMATRTTVEILAHYGLSNPHDSAKQFLQEAIQLAGKLQLRALTVKVEGKATALNNTIRYQLAAEDRWGQPLATTSDDAADVLAETARISARRFGLSQRGQWPPKL